MECQLKREVKKGMRIRQYAYDKTRHSEVEGCVLNNVLRDASDRTHPFSSFAAKGTLDSVPLAAKLLVSQVVSLPRVRGFAAKGTRFLKPHVVGSVSCGSRTACETSTGREGDR